MTEKEFNHFCSLQHAGETISISYREFNLSGRLIGCWEDSLVIDIKGQRAIWPRELCDIERRTNHTPSYS